MALKGETKGLLTRTLQVIGLLTWRCTFNQIGRTNSKRVSSAAQVKCIQGCATRTSRLEVKPPFCGLTHIATHPETSTSQYL